MSNQENLANPVPSNKSIPLKYLDNKTSWFWHVHQQKEVGFLEEYRIAKQCPAVKAIFSKLRDTYVLA